MNDFDSVVFSGAGYFGYEALHEVYADDTVQKNDESSTIKVFDSKNKTLSKFLHSVLT